MKTPTLVRRLSAILLITLVVGACGDPNGTAAVQVSAPFCPAHQPASSTLMVEVNGNPAPGRPTRVKPGSTVSLRVGGVIEGWRAQLSPHGEFGPSGADVRSHGIGFGHVEGQLWVESGPRDPNARYTLAALDGGKTFHAPIPKDVANGTYVICLKGDVRPDRGGGESSQNSFTLAVAVEAVS